MKQLTYLLGRLDLAHTAQLRRILFFNKLEKPSNVVLLNLFKSLQSRNEFHRVMTIGQSLHVIDGGFSVAEVKRLIVCNFGKCVGLT